MPRPALKKERREQILLAFERCIAKYGLSGATLEHVAKEAGLARALIRHNVGNREDLEALLIERFFARSEQEWQRLLAALPNEQAALSMIDVLFDQRQHDPQLVLITEAITAAAVDDKRLSQRLTQWLEDAIEWIAVVLARDYTAASRTDCRQVAAGILGIYFNVDSFALIGNLVEFRQNSKGAAMRLLLSLNVN